MRIRYFPCTLSRREQENIEIVLMEELDVQEWFTVAYSSILRDELIIILQ